MSTATLRQPSQQQRALSDQSPQQLRDASNSRSTSHPHSSKQEEKNIVITNYEIAVGREIVPAEQIPHDSKRKQLGFSSQKLHIEDFELMKTLGTGTVLLRALGNHNSQSEGVADHTLCTGTFARVWLARFADHTQEDRNKVFALKVLRKIDGLFPIHLVETRKLSSIVHSHQVEAGRTCAQRAKCSCCRCRISIHYHPHHKFFGRNKSLHAGASNFFSDNVPLQWFWRNWSHNA